MIFWLVIACLPQLSFQTVVTISNRDPRRDNTGEIMDCHDGNILRVDDMYWLYCMAYGSCHNTHCATATCGGRIDHNVSIYRSKNLTSGSWEYVADLLPVEHRLSGTYYRPKTVFNPNTNKYVFWINVLPRPSASSPPDFSKSSYLVATSPAPEGPFTVVNTNATTRHGEGGDFSLFVDDDHTGYIIYTSLSSNHAISIAPLTPNFTESIPAQNTVTKIGCSNVAKPHHNYCPRFSECLFTFPVSMTWIFPASKLFYSFPYCRLSYPARQADASTPRPCSSAKAFISRCLVSHRGWGFMSGVMPWESSWCTRHSLVES